MNEIFLLPEASEKSDVILVKLMEAKAEMGSSVKKDSTNPFHKSKYASLGAHLDLCEPVLLKHGLLMVPTGNIINNQHVLVATLHHPASGQWLKTYLPLPNPKGDSQGIGASLTYMRRYAINSLFSLNAEDDDGETASGRGKYTKQQQEKAQKEEKIKEQQKEENYFVDDAPEEKITKAEIVAIQSLLPKLDQESKNNFFDWIKKKYDAHAIHDLPKSAYEKCMASINNKIKYLNDKTKQQQQQTAASAVA